MHEHIGAAIAATPLRDLDNVARILWKAHGAGLVGDDDAQRLAEAIEARRGAARTAAKPAGGVRPGRSIFPPRRPPQRPPDRQRSIERRRTLAASSPLPPHVSARFTLSEQASLRIILDEAVKHGRCSRSLPEIAARAGCGVTTVRNALREAQHLGLVVVIERRRPGRPNLPNLVSIVSPELKAWLSRTGCKFSKPTANKIQPGPARGGRTALSAGPARPGWSVFKKRSE